MLIQIFESLKDYQAAASQPARSHLELQAANYGPDDWKLMTMGEIYKNTSPLQHKLLYDVATSIIKKLSNGPVVLYLNDISKPGLDRAVENLEKYLIEKIGNEEWPDVDIQIVKIVGDMFRVEEWPEVDTANALNLAGSLTRRLLTLRPGEGADSNLLGVVLKVARASKTGLYVTDVNTGERTVAEVTETLQRGPQFRGPLRFELDRQSEFGDYYFPDGTRSDLSNRLCYRIRFCPLEQQESLIHPEDDGLSDIIMGISNIQLTD